MSKSEEWQACEFDDTDQVILAVSDHVEAVFYVLCSFMANLTKTTHNVTSQMFKINFILKMAADYKHTCAITHREYMYCITKCIFNGIFYKVNGKCYIHRHLKFTENVYCFKDKYFEVLNCVFCYRNNDFTYAV